MDKKNNIKSSFMVYPLLYICHGKSAAAIWQGLAHFRLDLLQKGWIRILSILNNPCLLACLILILSYPSSTRAVSHSSAIHCLWLMWQSLTYYPDGSRLFVFSLLQLHHRRATRQHHQVKTRMGFDIWMSTLPMNYGKTSSINGFKWAILQLPYIFFVSLFFGACWMSPSR